MPRRAGWRQQEQEQLVALILHGASPPTRAGVGSRLTGSIFHHRDAEADVGQPRGLDGLAPPLAVIASIAASS
jgi:hypothetical protein